MGDPRRITQELVEVEYSPPDPGPRRITQLLVEVEYLVVPDEDQTQIRGHDQIQPWSITSDRLSQEVAGAGLRGGGPEGPLYIDEALYPAPSAQGQVLVSNDIPQWVPSLTPTWLGTHVFNAGLTIAAAQAIAMGDEAYIGCGPADVRIVFDAGNDMALLGGNVGIGADPPTAQLHVQDLAVSMTATYYGVKVYHTKTAGASDVADSLFGLAGITEMNHAAATIGNLSGLRWETVLTDGNVGSGIAARAVFGSRYYTLLDGGKVWGDVYGLGIRVDQAGANEVTGDIQGLNIWIDADGTTGGIVYMLYLEEYSNVDYGIYQEGPSVNYFGGAVGIGRNNPSGHLDVYDNAVDTTDDYYGIYNYHAKTAGASDHSDNLYGISTLAILNQAAGEIGYFIGISNVVRLTDGNVGDVGNLRQVRGGDFQIALNGGKVWGDVYGLKAVVDKAGANEVTGDIYGEHIWIDADGVTGGLVYMLYLEEYSNIDYGIYQDGDADNYFGGNLGIGTASPQGPLHLAKAPGSGMFITADDVAGGAVTLIANGAGDVTAVLGVTYVVNESGGGTDGNFVMVENSASVDLYDDGTDVLTLTVAADGSVTIVRSAGAATFDVSMWMVWL